MSKKARTPLFEYDDHYAIELPGDRPPQERDRLSDQALIVAYDLRPGPKPRWRLRALRFDRSEWTRTGIRRWWAAHEVKLLAADQLDMPIPEVCRAYDAPSPTLPTIVLCHRNTPLLPARSQIGSLKKDSGHGRKGRG